MQDARRPVGTVVQRAGALLATALLAACTPAGQAALPAASPTTADSATSTQAATASPSASADPEATARRIETTLLLHEFSGAALVARGDEVLYRGALGTADAAAGKRNTPETLFKAGSVHKQMDAALILSLADEGLIELDGSICQGIKDCPPSLENVTYHQVLTHTSGIPELTDEVGAQIDTNEKALRVIGDARRLFEPGEGWAYSSTAYSLFTATPELLTGRPLAELLDEHVYGPAGLEETGLAGFDGPVRGAATGHVTPGGEPVPDPIGTWTTVDDLRRWHDALVAGNVLPADLLALMEKPHAEIEPGIDYGYGVEVREVDGHREVAHRGGTPGFAAYLSRFPDEDAVVVLLANAETVDVNALRDLLVAEVFRGPG